MNSSNTNTAGGAYRDAGVDIDLSHRLLDQVRGKMSAATRPEVLGGIGGFGGLFQLDLSRYQEPVLVSSVDGVGTKLMVAARMNEHRSVGFDIVNHCINDIIVQGAEPLWFMDYLGIGALRSPLYEQILEGVAEACQAQDVALLGGETAEMPGMYGDDYDLVGCITGVVEKSALLTGERIRPGHVAIGLASNGLHTNGYSLARKALFDTGCLDAGDYLPELEETVGDALLKPHTCYWPVIRQAFKQNLPVDGLVHVTGGGLYDNVPRVLPTDCSFEYRPGLLPIPPVFPLIQEHAQTDDREMYRVFNMGVGMLWFVPAEAMRDALELCQAANCAAEAVGHVVEGDGTVRIRGLDTDAE